MINKTYKESESTCQKGNYSAMKLATKKSSKFVPFLLVLHKDLDFLFRIAFKPTFFISMLNSKRFSNKFYEFFLRKTVHLAISKILICDIRGKMSRSEEKSRNKNIV